MRIKVDSVGALSLIEGVVGVGLILLAFIRLKRMPKRWL